MDSDTAVSCGVVLWSGVMGWEEVKLVLGDTAEDYIRHSGHKNCGVSL